MFLEKQWKNKNLEKLIDMYSVAMVVIFVLGYLCIALEHPLKIDKLNVTFEQIKEGNKLGFRATSEV